jgi:diguanylate cyclase (GGDEF)-like protein
MAAGGSFPRWVSLVKPPAPRWGPAALLVAMVASAFVWIDLSPWLNGGQRTGWSSMLRFVIPLAVMAFVAVRAKENQCPSRTSVLAFRGLLAGVGTAMVGDLIGFFALHLGWSLYETHLATLPIYGLACSAVFFSAAVGVRACTGALRKRLVALDGLIVFAGVASLWWAFWLAPVMTRWGQTDWGKLELTARPVVGTLLFSLILAAVLQVWNKSERSMASLMVAGAAGLMIADVLGAEMLLSEGAVSPALHSGVVAASYVLLVLGAMEVRADRRWPIRRRAAVSLARLAVPSLALSLALASLAASVWLESGWAIVRGAVVWSVVAAVALSARQIMAVAESQSLAEELTESALRLESEVTKMEEAFRHMEEIAVTDNLTGLPNRRALMVRLEEETARAARFGTKLSVIAADIDHFKALNDDHGHLAGDEALKAVSSALVSGLRTTDFVARYGGEEFIALLPGSNEAEAAQIAERMRHDVQRLEGLAMRVTVSLGVGEWRPDDSDPNQVIDRTDAALYAAKNAGRNQVRLASQEVFGLNPHPGREDRSRVGTATDPKVQEAIDFACGLQGWGQTDSSRELVRGLIAALELRSAGEGARPHIAMWATLRLLLSLQEPSFGSVDRSLAARLALGALLHDVGKIGIEDQVVRKRGVLTEHERERAADHTVLGSNLVGCFDSLKGAAGLVRSHHERWDGGGYPDRLCGEAIPLEARIFSVIDAYLAMRSPRSYRNELSTVQAWTQIERDNGRQFDPLIVRAFLSVPIEEWESVRTGDCPTADLGQRVLKSLPSAA